MERQRAGQQRNNAAIDEEQADVSAHHISSIAHLFFDEGETANPGQAPGGNRRFMVFSAGSSPVAAVAAAGLSMGSKGEFFKGRVVLRENEKLAWSSRSFLEKSYLHALGPAGTGENEGDDSDRGSAWLIQPSAGAAASLHEKFNTDGTVRWFHAGCADDDALLEMESITSSQKWGRGISGGADGLVWCLLESEAVSLIPAYRLGRLISLLQPRQVEILIFPDSWSKTGKPLWQRKLFRARNNSQAHQDSLVNRCRELATAVGDCNVTLLPESLAQGSDRASSSGDVLQMVASRMLVID